uniref:TPX2 C-terminal domain-containing protein n=1 Tax=Aegilops tauschii subsp. strangulata TaxID=200361 RepID=A0A453G709_AEGTS
MATEVNQTFFAWSQGETTDLGVSETLNHGSVSFGRFELESLSWEKWSVFSNDKRHEEFVKFNGLVAQKKAYFEEYYKKIRELKASQQQIQQTELTLEYSGDGSDSSQTEDMPAEELETPTGSGTIVYDYVEGAAHETTSEQGMQCYHDHEDEDFRNELSSSNLVSEARISQQTDQDGRKNALGDNSDSADVENAGFGHDGLGAAHENARAPRRNTEKDPRLRYASMIIPKSVKTVAGSPLDRTSVTKTPGSVKPNMITNQKTKTNNVRSSSVASQKMAGAPRTRRITEKEALGVTGVKRPSSAAGRVTSIGEKHPITRATAKKPADVSTPGRPSTAERRPVTRERAQKQAAVATPCRPSTSERRPVDRGSAAKRSDVEGTRRPSTGERPSVTRDSVRTPSKTAASSVAHPKSTLKRPAPLNATTKSTKPEPKSSVNLPARKMLSSSVGEATFARLKKKEGIPATGQSRASASKKTTPLQTGNTKSRAPNPPTPPPPPRRPSRTTSKPTVSGSSVGGRKPKASTTQWH